ncbi:hypothetical protein P0D72_14350 [Paraburkholderia sediminicola]|uniref:hypothetical protein n=1 Tax=Paraburkholderia sediminicola TaxID=458836 RepID=UPI0038BA0686
MGAPKHHANRVGLSLVVDNSRAGDRSADLGMTSTQRIPEGWFGEEVGYVGALPSALRVVPDADESGWDGRD